MPLRKPIRRREPPDGREALEAVARYLAVAVNTFDDLFTLKSRRWGIRETYIVIGAMLFVHPDLTWRKVSDRAAKMGVLGPRRTAQYIMTGSLADLEKAGYVTLESDKQRKINFTKKLVEALNKHARLSVRHFIGKELRQRKEFDANKKVFEFIGSKYRSLWEGFLNTLDDCGLSRSVVQKNTPLGVVVLTLMISGVPLTGSELEAKWEWLGFKIGPERAGFALERLRKVEGSDHNDVRAAKRPQRRSTLRSNDEIKYWLPGNDKINQALRNCIDKLEIEFETFLQDLASVC